jgi:hypothetical protein
MRDVRQRQHDETPLEFPERALDAGAVRFTNQQPRLLSTDKA